MPGADSSADTVVVNFPYHSCVASNCSNWILICVPLISHLAPQPLCNLFHNRERNRDVHTHARTLYTQSPETQTQAGRQACKVTHVQREWRTHDRSKKEVREKQREKKKAGGGKKERHGSLFWGIREDLSSLSWPCSAPHEVQRSDWFVYSERAYRRPEGMDKVAHLSQSVWTVTVKLGLLQP